MTEKRIAGRKFIEGKGWQIDESQPLNPASPAAQAAVAPQPITVAQVEKLAAGFGLAVVDAAEYEATLARIAELEEVMNEVDAAVESIDDAPTPAPRKRGKRGKKAAKVTAEAIAATETLEELSALMFDVENTELLALADARADEMTAGGKK